SSWMRWRSTCARQRSRSAIGCGGSSFSSATVVTSGGRSGSCANASGRATTTNASLATIPRVRRCSRSRTPAATLPPTTGIVPTGPSRCPCWMPARKATGAGQLSGGPGSIARTGGSTNRALPYPATSVRPASVAIAACEGRPPASVRRRRTAWKRESVIESVSGAPAAVTDEANQSIDCLLEFAVGDAVGKPHPAIVSERATRHQCNTFLRHQLLTEIHPGARRGAHQAVDAEEQVERTVRLDEFDAWQLIVI